MHIVILSFDQFNEIDTFVALNILNRIIKPDWKVTIASPNSSVCSMNGVVIQTTSSLADLSHADAVIIGSGRKTREVVADPALMQQIKLDPSRQLLAAQCSGTLILSKLGLLDDIPACTDLATKPWVIEAGIEVLDQPFYAKGNIATSGGCLSSSYLATWIVARLEGLEAAKYAIGYVSPIGEKDEYVARAIKNIKPYL